MQTFRSYLTENSVYIVSSERLILFREVVGIYCENHASHIRKFTHCLKCRVVRVSELRQKSRARFGFKHNLNHVRWL